MSALPSPEKLQGMVDYNPETGLATWRWRSDLRQSCNTRMVGKPAFNSKDSRGYYRGQVCGKQLLLHRVAWAIYYGEWPTGQIDHINGDRQDNRIANLRDVSRVENMRNKGRSRKNTSGTTGVYWHFGKQKWTAEIRIGGDNKHLGYFAKIKDAIAARKAGSRLYGFHENHGTDRATGGSAGPISIPPIRSRGGSPGTAQSGAAGPYAAPGEQMRAVSTTRRPSGSCPTPAPLGQPIHESRSFHAADNIERIQRDHV